MAAVEQGHKPKASLALFYSFQEAFERVIRVTISIAIYDSIFYAAAGGLHPQPCSMRAGDLPNEF